MQAEPICLQAVRVLMDTENQYKARANSLAPVMFGLSTLFVVLLGVLIVLWVDIPRVAEISVLSELDRDAVLSEAIEDDVEAMAVLIQQRSLVKLTDPFGKMIQLALFVLWPLFWLEFLVSHWHSDRSRVTTSGGFLRLLACAVPPVRLAAPSAAHLGRVWLPLIGWQLPGKALVNRLEHAFGKPMLAIAMLILPILLIEYGLHSLVEEKEWLRLVLHISTGFIWCAFTIEFLILFSVTDKRLAYIKAHWIDLAIILLPLISFLRSFRVLRLAKLAKVQKIAKMGRVFRVRGLLMKALRAMMLLGFVNRLLRITPEKQLVKLQKQYSEREEELRELKAEIDELEAGLKSSQGA